MTRGPLFASVALAFAGCALKVVGPAPEAIVQTAVPDTAWLGMVDVREREGATSQGMSVTPVYVHAAGSAPGTSMIVPVAHPTSVYTGELRAPPIAATLGKRLQESVLPTSLAGAAGTDIGGLTGVQAVSAAYPEHRCLVVFDLSEATADLQPLRRKGMGVGIVTGITLGLAYPFILPWVNAPLQVPYTATGTLKVSRADTRRFEQMAEVTTEGSVTVRGVPWANKAHEPLIEAAARASGAGLAASAARLVRCEAIEGGGP